MPEEINEEIASGPRYAGRVSLLNAPLQTITPDLDIALIGVPFDGGAENRPGQRLGPLQVRTMSRFIRRIHHVTRMKPFELCRIADVGDVQLADPFALEASLDQITSFLLRLKQAGIVPLCVGGDHSISLPILRALASDQPVGLVQFDAHTDTHDTELGCRFTHGTPFRRAVEEELIDPKRTVQIGIRGTQDSEAGWNFALDSGMRVIFIEEFFQLGVEGVVAEIRCKVGDAPVYISVDIDCLDPAFAPGTGTPEIGGLTPLELQMMIRGLAGLSVIGADVVEVCPPYDQSGSTALIAATLTFELLCVLVTAIKG